MIRTPFDHSIALFTVILRFKVECKILLQRSLKLLTEISLFLGSRSFPLQTEQNLLVVNDRILNFVFSILIGSMNTKD